MMDVPSQVEGAYLGGNVTLKCRSQAFPASINYWVRGAGDTVTSGKIYLRLHFVPIVIYNQVDV